MPETSPAPIAWHTLKLERVVTELRTGLEPGLTEPEAQQRLMQYGPNELPEAPPTSPLTLLLAQFSSVIIWVLIGAAIISGLQQEWLDAAAILAIVVLNGALGFVQEYRAERSLAALLTGESTPMTKRLGALPGKAVWRSKAY